VLLVVQELLTLSEYLSSPPVFSGVRVTRSLVLCVCFVDRCLYFFFWPLCCLFFCDIRILITPLVYSNSSYTCHTNKDWFQPIILHIPTICTCIKMIWRLTLWKLVLSELWFCWVLFYLLVCVIVSGSSIYSDIISGLGYSVYVPFKWHALWICKTLFVDDDKVQNEQIKQTSILGNNEWIFKANVEYRRQETFMLRIITCIEQQQYETNALWNIIAKAWTS